MSFYFIFYFCDAAEGIKLEFSTAKTLQQNGVVERKNKTSQEMAGVMQNGKGIAHKFWVEVVNTTVYVSTKFT